jgi:hypothetical protein
MRLAALLAFAVIASGANLRAQDSKNVTPEVTKEPEEKTWSCSLSAATYVVPDFREYVQPTFTADHSWLHIESRYNYENLKSGSLWVGYNFGGGEKLAWEFTPMFGGVFGDTTGVAPGYRLSLSYWKLELSSEGEFVFDTHDSEGSFLYFWSELSIAPVDWFRFGLVGQRTRAYQADVDIQRGILVGFSHKDVDFTTYVFNLDRGKPTWVFSVGMSF